MIHTKTNTSLHKTGRTPEPPVLLLPAQTSIQGSALARLGTMGCCLLLNNRLYGMTNYHVLFGEHSPEYVQKHLAETLEVNSPHHETGSLKGKATPIFNSTLDYAIFEILSNFDQTTLLSLGKPIEPHIGMSLNKTGAATGLTYATIDESSRLDEALIILCTDERNPSKKICDYGDSGSLWLYDDGSPHHRPVALHAGTSIHHHLLGRAYSFAAILADICLHLPIE